jgi:iron complex transport system substrate-binding protein
VNQSSPFVKIAVQGVRRFVKSIARSMFVFGMLGSCATVRADIRVHDDAGRLLVLPAPAQRVVSLSPHITELLFAVGAGSQIVGVSALSDYPEEARQLPRISGGVRLDIEQILALRPDLVVGWLSGNARSDLDRFVHAGIPVFIAEPRRLSEVPDTMVNLGTLTGHDADARRVADSFRKDTARLRADVHGRRPVRVLLEVSAQPLMTLSHVHMVNDMLSLCGGRNIFAASETIAPVINLEDVLLEEPDAVLFSSSLGSVSDVRDWWQDRVPLRAVRAGRLYAFNGDLVLRQGPRAIEGARQICSLLDAARASLASEGRR